MEDQVQEEAAQAQEETTEAPQAEAAEVAPVDESAIVAEVVEEIKTEEKDGAIDRRYFATCGRSRRDCEANEDRRREGAEGRARGSPEGRRACPDGRG